MALETLEGLESIGGFKIVLHKPPEMSWDAFDKMRDEYPISITDRLNMISFKMQNGPIKEVGVNGCQVDTLIQTAEIMLDKLNDKFPSHYNRQAIMYLRNALDELEKRRLDRESRGVEGYNKE